MWDLVADSRMVAHYNQLNTPHFTVWCLEKVLLRAGIWFVCSGLL